jgi:hypothetical protein
MPEEVGSVIQGKVRLVFECYRLPRKLPRFERSRAIAEEDTL